MTEGTETIQPLRQCMHEGMRLHTLPPNIQTGDTRVLKHCAAFLCILLSENRY